MFKTKIAAVAIGAVALFGAAACSGSDSGQQDQSADTTQAGSERIVEPQLTPQSEAERFGAPPAGFCTALVDALVAAPLTTNNPDQIEAAAVLYEQAASAASGTDLGTEAANAAAFARLAVTTLRTPGQMPDQEVLATGGQALYTLTLYAEGACDFTPPPLPEPDLPEAELPELDAPEVVPSNPPVSN